MSEVARSIHVWLNVINALLLRDIRVRSGKFFVGYVVIFSMPFFHLGILLLIYSLFFKRPPSFGNSDNYLFWYFYAALCNLRLPITTNHDFPAFKPTAPLLFSR